MFENPGDSGLSFLDVLLVIFVVLKLCDLIDWSWWWVTSPIWIPLSVAIVLGIVVVMVDPH